MIGQRFQPETRSMPDSQTLFAFAAVLTAAGTTIVAVARLLAEVRRHRELSRARKRGS